MRPFATNLLICSLLEVSEGMCPLAPFPCEKGGVAWISTAMLGQILAELDVEVGGKERDTSLWSHRFLFADDNDNVWRISGVISKLCRPSLVIILDR
jgi:hypothetical protein